MNRVCILIVMNDTMLFIIICKLTIYYFYYADISEKIKKNHQKIIIAYLENIFGLSVEVHA